MRLLNVHTLELQEFLGRDIPPYVILSHTWGKEEISYQEYQAWLVARKADSNTPDSAKEGFRKVVRFCQICQEYDLTHNVHGVRVALQRESVSKGWIARQSQRGFPIQWGWVDTCCIDKSSSTELSEAINSMYQWYQDSALCISILEDVDQDDDGTDILAQFENSRWLTRGWTLQELLAPQEVHFYDRNWSMFWSRSGNAAAISNATSIDQRFLGELAFRSQNDPKKELAAVKFSWAANRTTTRDEDRAYCLFGLFGVHMPLIYDEGTKAFVRLQDEIVKVSEDHSLLMWTVPTALYHDRGFNYDAVCAWSPGV